MTLAAKTTIAFSALLIALTAPSLVAQESPMPLLPPQPVPPLSEKQREAVQQLIQQELGTTEPNQALDERIRAEVKDTFGWTLALINLLITVLIAIPIVTAIVAWTLRRSVLLELVNETKKQLREETEQEVKQQLEQQVSIELQNQIEAFKQELETQKAAFITQLQSLFVAAQQEKDQIFQELANITSTSIQEELIAPEVQRRIQELTNQLEQLKSTNPQLYLTTDDYVRQGDAFLIDQRTEDALFSYEKAIALQPELVTAWIGKEKALRRLKRYDEALAASEQALKLAPENSSAWFGVAAVLMDLQRYSEALKAFNKSIKLRPEKGSTWKYRGYVLTKLGRYSEALTSFEKAEQLSPSSGGVSYNKAYLLMNQGQTDQAIDHLKRSIDIHPKFRDILRTDPDFEPLQSDDRFHQLINP
jgi:tetratricopeptide (TPR) repeat protein